MKRKLRITALILVLAGAAYWAVAGANRGWTKNNIPIKTVDEVTGIEGITYEKRFVPGVDFLGVVAIGAAVLTGVSFLFRNEKART